MSNGNAENTSATGGYLLPTPTGISSIEGIALQRFLQQIVVNITGIDGCLVIPRWQQQAPNLPAIGTDWASIGVRARTPDTFNSEAMTDAGLVIHRNQILEILVSFYGPNADANNDLMQMGLLVSQNREFMKSQGFVATYYGPPTIAPELIQEQWLYRVDMSFYLRRVQEFTYPVETVLSAGFEIVTDPATETITETVS
jgi:hypothetical protein